MVKLEGGAAATGTRNTRKIRVGVQAVEPSSSMVAYSARLEFFESRTSLHKTCNLR